MARFWGIGVGPGDSQLLTVKAVETIKQLDVLYVPQAHKGGASVAETIAAPYLPGDLTIKRRHFPMANDWALKRAQWELIANEIVDDVTSGLEVGFLTLGDPSVYSTYSYLLEIIQDQVPVETIAGISSYSQLAASLSLPLVIDQESLSIVPATAGVSQLSRVIDASNNIVIMKVAADFANVYQLLAERNLLEQTMVVERVSMAEQVMKPMTEYQPDAKLPYFTTALVKKEGQNVNL